MEMVIGILPTEIPIVLEGTWEYFDIKWQLVGQDTMPLIICIPFLLLSAVSFSYYHRLKKKKKDTFDLESIKEPFVLYLRSFSEDKTTRKQVSFNDARSEEEVLVEVLSDIAPVYAIGDPKDKKMPIGASRIYVDDEHWKTTVAEMAEKSVAVVLRLGKTDSFWWEVDMVLQNIPHDKLLFIVPESKTFSNVAYLYKTLLKHNVDVKVPDICIDQKSSGSISSFLFFDKEGTPISKEVKTPRFTRVFLSYENIIRNTLDPFRSKYGLSPAHRTTVVKARIFLALLVGFLLFITGAKIFCDLTSLKYQMPYELVSKCICHSEFVEKYSDNIDGANLIYGIYEAKRGSFTLDDDNYMAMYMIEWSACKSMTRDELQQINVHPKNMLLMVKKYIPEQYDNYTDILSEAALIAVNRSDDMDALIEYYKSMVDYMPDWVDDALYPDEDFDSDYEYFVNFNLEVIKHKNDSDIVRILKTLASCNF